MIHVHDWSLVWPPFQLVLDLMGAQLPNGPFKPWGPLMYTTSLYGTRLIIEEVICAKRYFSKTSLIPDCIWEIEIKLSIQSTFVSGSRVIRIIHIHLMIYFLECTCTVVWDPARCISQLSRELAFWGGCVKCQCFPPKGKFMELQQHQNESDPRQIPLQTTFFQTCRPWTEVFDNNKTYIVSQANPRTLSNICTPLSTLCTTFGIVHHDAQFHVSFFKSCVHKLQTRGEVKVKVLVYSLVSSW